MPCFHKSHHENEVIWNPGLSDSLKGSAEGWERYWEDWELVCKYSRDRLRPKVLLGGSLDNGYGCLLR